MTQPTKSYRDSFSGYFAGIIPWEKFDSLWDQLKKEPENWYIFQPDSDASPPEKTLTKAEFLSKLDEIDVFLHDQQYADYCGCVYVDSTQDPRFIKVFHPRKMGSGCSLGGDNHQVILPWWTISKVKPEKMSVPEEPEQSEKKSVLGKLLGQK